MDIFTTKVAQRYFLRISLKVTESIFSPVGLGA